ncbi:SAM-dependent methyltransferase [Thiotrichales bacterium 19S11-10]|nr:SAM-dependent methyltransferase [Thiotrichales bacterium 19S11-10]
MVEKIKEEIKKSQRLFFNEYMQMALYTPNFGYYASATNPIGHLGDFMTAPELTPIFAQCFANGFIEIFDEVPESSILEFGAGNGSFASQLLLMLEEKKKLPQRYFILEVSPYLKERQRKTFKEQIPHLLDHIDWLDRLPEKNSFKGIIFANEVLDAMSVVRFVKRDNKYYELAVTVKNDQLELIEVEARSVVKDAILKIEDEVGDLSDGYTSEINLWIKDWIKSVANTLNQGAVYIVDYGYDRKEYYRDDRLMGTMQCYFKHKAHDNVLWYPGTQDITAHVDFTEVANGAIEAGLTFEGYTTQSSFLISCGLDKIYQRQYDKLPTKLQLELATHTKTLMMPGQMGEVFKVMALSQQLKTSLPGFEFRDLSFKL